MKTYQQIKTELQELQESHRHPKARGGPKNPLPMPEGQIAAKSVQFLLKELEEQMIERDHALKAAEKAQKARAAIVKAVGVDILDVDILDAAPITEEGETEESRRLFIKKYMPFAAGRIKERGTQVKSRDEYISELEGRLAASPKKEPDGPPVTWEIYCQALDRIKQLESLLSEQGEEPPAKVPPVPFEVYEGAMETIERLNVALVEWEAKIERLEARITSELERAGDLGHKLTMKEREIEGLRGAALKAKNSMEDQITVNRCAALLMLQKLKAAAVMAKTATAKQIARYLVDAVNFHLNGTLEVVKFLNEQDETEEAQDDQHITDGEEPR